MDWVDAAVTVGSVVGGHIISGLIRNAKRDSAIDQHARTLRKHEERLDGHDDRFERLASDFVPRAELTGALATINASTREVKQILTQILMHRAGFGGTEGSDL